MNQGSLETSTEELYKLLCESEFTKHCEQQDSHELLVFLQENITKMTADHLRETTTDPGFAIEDLDSFSEIEP